MPVELPLLLQVCICGECEVGCFRDYETEERGLEDLNKMKTESPSKRESTTVCAKIVNTDWDLVVYNTSYQEGVLEHVVI